MDVKQNWNKNETRDRPAIFPWLKNSYTSYKNDFTFIYSLKEFLPASYMKVKGIEKKVFREHKKHAGLSELDAKVLYTKTARELNTYGVAFFLVKVSIQIGLAGCTFWSKCVEQAVYFGKLYILLEICWNGDAFWQIVPFGQSTF